MADYLYSAWSSQATVALRLAMINLHIDEVSLTMTPDVTSDGQSQSNSAVQTYLQGLYTERDKLQSSPANIPGGGLFKLRRTRN